MYPDVNLKKQHGIGLPTAIFVVTVLALIIASMADLQGASSKGISLQIQSSRAFYTAESGIQIALNRLLPPDGSNGVSCNLVANEIYNQNFTASGLSACTVSVLCSRIEVNSENYYTLISTGTCGTGQNRAQRQIEVRAR